MVGQDTRRRDGKLGEPINSQSLASVVSRYLDKPFSWENNHCVGLVCDISRDIGKKVPEKAYDPADELKQLYKKDIAKLSKLLMGYMDNMGEEIDPVYKIAGDILILTKDGKNMFTAMYLGNGKAITSWVDIGVRVFALKPNLKIVSVKRFPNG
jgi:hypothetical protein